jgi:hypothetical protein
VAKKSKQDELFEMLRARGLRKRVARTIADAASKGGSATPKVVQTSVADLRALAAELEDRVTGGPGKRKAAAQKAAATRKRAAAKRSTAAKKAATTRARKTRSAASRTPAQRAASTARSAARKATSGTRSSGGTRRSTSSRARRSG